MKRINTIDEQEIIAVTNVLKSGNLSKFNASWGSSFLGGDRIQSLEKSICNRFNVKHAITVNSWSSGVLIAIGSLQLEPGDEIIVSPWNMCSTVTNILQWLCVPVFCDIETDTFSIDPNKIEDCITDRTRAIIINDMHGRPCDFDRIKCIAHQHKLKIISDSAQTIGATYKNKHSGTLADIGGFSFNWHKHLNCGEGGVIVTNDDDLAQKMQLLRNHAEGAVAHTNQNLVNMIGFNMRLTEIQAAILDCQLHKLDSVIEKRQTSAGLLDRALKKFVNYLTLPKHTDTSTNVYCSYPIVFNKSSTRNLVLGKLSELGYTVNSKFSRGCVHLLPVFQKRVVFGTTQIPWSLNNNIQVYDKGSLPVAENLEYFFLDICMEYEYNEQDVEIIERTIFQAIGETYD